MSQEEGERMEMTLGMQIFLISRAEMEYSRKGPHPLLAETQTFLEGAQSAHWVAEKSLRCNAGGTCQKQGAKESYSQGGVLLQAFCYKAFWGGVIEVAVSRWRNSVPEKDMYPLPEPGSKNTFLLCPLLTKLNIMLAGEEEYLKGPGLLHRVDFG